MGVGYLTIINWVKQLREERSGLKPKAAPMMAAKKVEIPELKKRIQGIQ
jgi:transposase